MRGGRYGGIRWGNPYIPWEIEVFLREFVLNYRHPGPRCVWKGGSEPRLRDRINGISGITGITGNPGLCPKVWFYLSETILFDQKGSFLVKNSRRRQRRKLAHYF